MKVDLEVKSIDLSEISTEGILELLRPKVVGAFVERIGPHFVEAAQNRAPVGKGRVDFQRINVKPSVPRGRPGSEQEKVHEFHGTFAAPGGRRLATKLIKRAGGSTTSSGFLSLFRGTRARGTLGRSPDIIQTRGRSFVGGFTHTAGTLRESIKIDSIEAAGETVTMIVRAHAPYARWVHEGYNHRGGAKHKGETTHIKGKPFLRWALVNIHEELMDPKTYTG